MTELENIGKLAATASELLNAIRGGEIANMKAEHVQVLEDFETAYNAKINEFTQQKGEALNQFNQEKAQAFAAADSQLKSRRAAVDAVLTDVSANTNMFVHHFDQTVHSQSSLNIPIDPNDETKTQWLKVPTDSMGKHGAAVPSKKTMVVLPMAYVRPGGYPDYETDTSVNRMEFILANFDATSEQINAEIASRNIILQDVGSWGNGAATRNIPCIHIHGQHSYKALYVRFVSKNYAKNQPAQNVIDYGGNPSFCVDRVINFFDVPA